MARRGSVRTDGERADDSGRGRDWRKGERRLGVEEIEGFCEAYFERCKEMVRRPTKPGLALSLGISEDTFSRWVSEEGEVGGLLKKALSRMSDELQQRNDAMAIFSLKQPCYGGFTEKPADDKGNTINVAITFGNKGGKAAAEYGK